MPTRTCSRSPGEIPVPAVNSCRAAHRSAGNRGWTSRTAWRIVSGLRPVRMKNRARRSGSLARNMSTLATTSSELGAEEGIDRSRAAHQACPWVKTLLSNGARRSSRSQLTKSVRCLSSPGSRQAHHGRDRLHLNLRFLPRLLRVLEAVGRCADFRLAAKQRPCAGPQHNPAAVMRAKVEQPNLRARNGGLGGFLVSQPPELVLSRAVAVRLGGAHLILSRRGRIMRQVAKPGGARAEPCLTDAAPRGRSRQAVRG